MPWTIVCTRREGSPVFIDGVDVWAHSWLPAALPPLQISHPQYPNQVHKLPLFHVELGGRVLEFAAGEVSSGVWVFYQYVPVSPERKHALLLVAGAFLAGGLCAIPFRSSTFAQLVFLVAALGFFGSLEALASLSRRRDDVV